MSVFHEIPETKTLGIVAYKGHYYLNTNGAQLIASYKRKTTFMGLKINMYAFGELFKPQYQFINIARNEYHNGVYGGWYIVGAIFAAMAFLGACDGIFWMYAFLDLLIGGVICCKKQESIDKYWTAYSLVMSNEFYRLNLLSFRAKLEEDAITRSKFSFGNPANEFAELHAKYATENKGLLDYFLECDDEAEARRRYNAQFMLYTKDFQKIFIPKESLSDEE